MVEQPKSRGVEMPEKLRRRVEQCLVGQAMCRAEESRNRTVAMPIDPKFRFEKLTVWQSARTLSGEVYSATQGFPREELFGLTSQLRRAAVSITANIAE